MLLNKSNWSVLIIKKYMWRRWVLVRTDGMECEIATRWLVYYTEHDKAFLESYKCKRFFRKSLPFELPSRSFGQFLGRKMSYISVYSHRGICIVCQEIIIGIQHIVFYKEKNDLSLVLFLTCLFLCIAYDLDSWYYIRTRRFGLYTLLL